jgi:glycosyltransferase involved in cell wall biosynthesis
VYDMGLHKYKYIVAHDGHSNQSAFITPFDNKGEKLDVGYFGKLSERKGLDILRFLDNQDDIDFRMHIFSPDTVQYKWFSNKVEVGYVEHDEILSKMASMDVLLLPIQSVSLRDYSRYTSPLKLFEYASVGRLILLSSVSSLHGLNFPQGIYFCDKESDWIATLRKIKNSKTYVDTKILEDIKKWSSDYTWNKRVKKILEHDFN